MIPALAIPAFTPFANGIIGFSAPILGYFGYEAYTSSETPTLGTEPVYSALPTSKTKESIKQSVIPQVYGETLKSNFSSNTQTSETFKTSAQNVKDYTDANKVKTDELLSNFNTPSMLQNQVLLQKTLNDISSSLAISANISVATAEILNTNLNSLTVSVMGIAKVLQEISSGYSETIEHSKDIPYQDTETFYNLMRDNGMSIDESEMLRLQELTAIDAMQSQNIPFSDIKANVMTLRKSTISASKMSGLAVASAGVTKPSSSTVKDYSPYYERMAQSADSSKVVNDFMSTPIDVKDMDGNIQANITPMDLHATKNATVAREKTDTNELTFDEDDFKGAVSLAIGLPIIGFTSNISDTFDPNYDNLDDKDPFTQIKNVGGN
ncbi:MAG: hypothetical protein GQ570_11195 [Helicobacteraceae bacterium]|nr:hypothetical protein [Helicobacteraceae bacterium]